jgi:integrase
MVLRDIRPMHIQSFISHMGGYSKAYAGNNVTRLKSIMQSAADDGLIVKSPFRREDRAAGGESKSRDPLTDQQVKTLLEGTKGTQAYTFCLLAAATGLRRGEIIGLKWEDIDFETNHIHVTHNKTLDSSVTTTVTEDLKTSAARRVIPIPDTLRTHLLQLRGNSSSEYVIHDQKNESLGHTAFQTMWRAADRIARENDFHCHPHLLRHTYITKLFESGLDMKQVQYLAGHSTPSMTLRVYTHYRRKEREAETAKQVQSAVDYLD